MYAVSRAFCQWQTVDLNCTEPGHVLLVLSARYGRMKVGRCVTKNYGYVGCSVDVLDHVGAVCSARPSCRFEVPDHALKQLQPCPRDLAFYLEITYVCVPGIVRSLPLPVINQLDLRCMMSHLSFRVGMGGIRELLDGKIWEWDLSFRWEWE